MELEDWDDGVPSGSAVLCVIGRGGVGDVMEMAGNGCVVSVVCDIPDAIC